MEQGLERAYQARDGGLMEAHAVPYYRPYHQDPRWIEMMKRLGFRE
jgi:hypothetical protein